MAPGDRIGPIVSTHEHSSTQEDEPGHKTKNIEKVVELTGTLEKGPTLSPGGTYCDITPATIAAALQAIIKSNECEKKLGNCEEENYSGVIK